jgi:integrase
MKLRKNDNGVYVASFRTPTGTKEISTKTTSLDVAKKVAREAGVEELEHAALAGRLTREVIGHITTGRKLTMSKAVEAWVQWMQNTGKSPKTIHNHASVVAMWVREIGLSSTPPSAITEKEINKFINAKGDNTYGTRANSLAAIRSYFGLCCARGWSIANPSLEVVVKRELLEHGQLEPKVRQPFTEPEIKQILKFCEDRINREEANHWDYFWWFAVAAASELGLRLMAIAMLEWESFSKGGHIIITKNKRNRRLELPISEGLSQMTTRIPVMDSMYVFPQQCNAMLNAKNRSMLSVYFGRLCARLGIKGKSFHCIRHMVATEKYAKADKTALAKKLADALTVEEIGKLLGHSNAGTTRGYLH